MVKDPGSAVGGEQLSVPVKDLDPILLDVRDKDAPVRIHGRNITIHSARFAVATKSFCTRKISASVMARGTFVKVSPNGIALGAIVGHPPCSSDKCAPPFHGKSADALRPACAIWMPSFFLVIATSR